jgi:GT2 family glycosyltransferase
MARQHFPKVTASVTNVRGTNFLEQCLQALTKTDYPALEIIVVDCQTPQISEWIHPRFPSVRVIHFENDIGPSASHNVGAENAHPNSKYIAFLDNDAFVEPNWLKECVKLMEKDKTIGIVQPKIMITDSEEHLDHVGLALDALGTWNSLFYAQEKDYREVLDIFAASLATCLIRRTVFDLAAGFDESYFIYDDDTDFCWRTQLHGYRIVFLPSAKAYHKGQVTKSMTPKRLYHSTKNRIYTMLKNYELPNLWTRSILFFTLSLLTAFALMLLLKSDLAAAMIKGLVSPVLNLKNVWQKRQNIQASRKVSDRNLFERRLLRKDVHPTVLDVKRKALAFMGTGQE